MSIGNENPQPQEPVDDRPYYARRDNRGIYVREGEELPSVTTILGCAPGQHLMSWYGKQAAMKAASHLVQAGIPIPEDEPGSKGKPYEKLREFCASIKTYDLDLSSAMAEILNWATVMREAERYRDHKARIGSVTHHAIYEYAMHPEIIRDFITTTKTIDPKDIARLEDYCRYTAIRLHLWRDSHGWEFLPTEEMIDEVAKSAVAYVWSALDWIEDFQPEWDMIGQEAVVVRQDPGDGTGYAGTMDLAARFRREIWERHAPWVWPTENVVRLTGDIKTSNALSTSVQAQLEAYTHADFIGLMASGEQFDVPVADSTMALHVGPHKAFAQTSDEYGTLESHAKVIGTKAYTYERSEDTWEAFLGLCQWYRWSQNIPKAHQQQKRAPKDKPLPKTEERKVPF